MPDPGWMSSEELSQEEPERSPCPCSQDSVDSVLGSRDAGHHPGPRLWEKQLQKLDGAQGEPKEGTMKAPS